MSSPVSWEDYATGPSECAPEWSWAWEGLVGLWAPALGATGNALFDLSGRGNNGVLTNMDPATDWVGSPYGWALDFDGSNDVVVAPGVALGNAMSVVCIAYSGDWDGPGGYAHAVCQRNNAAYNWSFSANTDYGYRLWTLSVRTASGNALQAAAYPADRSWAHMVGTWSATENSGYPLLYFDGRLMPPYAEQVAQTANATSSSAVPFGIGNRVVSADRAFVGAIALAMVYNRVLTRSEVTALAADPLGLLRPAGFGAELWYIAAGGGTAYTSTLTDAIGLADSITRAMTRAITDALNSSDTILRATARTVTEALTIADAVTRGTGRTITDAASLTDAILRGTSRALTEATSAADTITRGTGRAITDSIGATDPAILRAMARIYADTVGVADARNVEMARAIADALGLADTATVTLMGTAATGLRDVLVIVDTRDRLIIGDLRSILRVD